jgi:hypothetical protein
MAIEYRQVLLGSAQTLEELSIYRAQEEQTPEGSLIMLELHFNEAIPEEQLENLNDQCVGTGVVPWPESSRIAYYGENTQSINMYWVKGLAWMPIIIGIVGLTILPALLGAFVWWIIPEEVKGMINMIVMMLVMMLMMKMMTPMMDMGSSEKQVRRESPKLLTEGK